MYKYIIVFKIIIIFAHTLYLPFVQEHVETSCEGAQVTCKYCGENVLRRDIKRHERLACEEVPGSSEFQAVGGNHDKVTIYLQSVEAGSDDKKYCRNLMF